MREEEEGFDEKRESRERKIQTKLGPASLSEARMTAAYFGINFWMSKHAKESTAQLQGLRNEQDNSEREPVRRNQETEQRLARANPIQSYGATTTAEVLEVLQH